MKLESIIALFVIIITVVSILPFRFRFHYLKKGKDDFCSLTWQVIPGLWGITTEIPFIKISLARLFPFMEIITEVEGEKGTPVLETKKRIMFGRRLIYKIVKYFRLVFTKTTELIKFSKWFFHKVSVRELKWMTEVGTGEPDKTGILVGVLWSINAILYQNLTYCVRRIHGQPKFCVVPNFKKQIMILDVDCIFDVPCGHIIIGGIKVLYLFKKKGG